MDGDLIAAVRRRIDEREGGLASVDPFIPRDALRAALHDLNGIVDELRQAELAHEINQPLAAIVNYARGIERRLQRRRPPAGVMQALEQITPSLSLPVRGNAHGEGTLGRLPRS